MDNFSFNLKSMACSSAALAMMFFSAGCQHPAQAPHEAIHHEHGEHEEHEAGHESAGSHGVEHDVARLKEGAPDQGHAMTDVDYHYSNLWFAGNAGNWPLAQFYWSETRAHMHWAVRIIPIRKDSEGRDIKLRDILESIENTPSMQVGKAIEEKDLVKFKTAYRHTLEGCYGCHKASGKPFLRPQIPQRPATAIINFDPNATWPE